MLLLAIASDDLEVVRMLVDAEADLVEQKQDCRNPLNLARHYLVLQALGQTLVNDEDKQVEINSYLSAPWSNPMIEDMMSARVFIIDLLKQYGALNDGTDLDNALHGRMEYSIRRLAKIFLENTTISIDDNIEY